MPLDPGDEVTANELHLTMSNDGDLYRQMVQPWTRNFARRMKKGTFDKQKALKGLELYLVKEAVKRYKKQYGNIGDVSKAIRQEVAKLWFPAIEEEAIDLVQTGAPLTMRAKRMEA